MYVRTYILDEVHKTHRVRHLFHAREHGDRTARVPEHVQRRRRRASARHPPSQREGDADARTVQPHVHVQKEPDKHLVGCVCVCTCRTSVSSTKKNPTSVSSTKRTCRVRVCVHMPAADLHTHFDIASHHPYTRSRCCCMRCTPTCRSATPHASPRSSGRCRCTRCQLLFMRASCARSKPSTTGTRSRPYTRPLNVLFFSFSTCRCACR